MKNVSLINSGREILKDLLVQCSNEQFTMFKRMYCHKNINASIDEAIDLINPEKIDWAITQCERTVKKNNS